MYKVGALLYSEYPLSLVGTLLIRDSLSKIPGLWVFSHSRPLRLNPGLNWVRVVGSRFVNGVTGKDSWESSWISWDPGEASKWKGKVISCVCFFWIYSSLSTTWRNLDAVNTDLRVMQGTVDVSMSQVTPEMTGQLWRDDIGKIAKPCQPFQNIQQYPVPMRILVNVTTFSDDLWLVWVSALFFVGKIGQ